MKKTSNELLQFFGLKIGDKIKVEGFINPFVIFEDISDIQYVKEMSKNWICGFRGDIIDFIHKLLGNEYEIVKPKKIGEMRCDEMSCNECPLKAIDCDAIGKTLYEALEKYRKNLYSFNGPLKPFEKTFIDAIKAELDKDVEIKCQHSTH